MAVTIDGTNGITSPDFEPSSSTTPTNGLFLPAANTVGLATGSTERLRIDSSGNLGLGVTPSAWASSFKTLDVNTTGAFGATSGGAYTLYNLYFDSASTPRYKTNGSALYYGVEYNRHVWNIAPSGTAGNAISFTQAMTLDTSGNLGIGTTSPTRDAGTASIGVSGGSSKAASIDIYGPTGSSGRNYAIYTSGTPNNGLQFYDLTAGAERARIDSSGNFLVGLTSATSGGGVLQVSNGITFPATQSASSNVNTLDDYEEGTWTPVITFGGASVGMTYSQQNGNYTKIGNFVIARAYIALTNKGTSTGAALLTGLPFTSKTVTAGYAIAKVYFNGMTGLSGADTCYLPPAATFLQLTCGVTGAIAGITSSNYANGSDNIFTICYQTD